MTAGLQRPSCLVGMMGAGKPAVGRPLAARPALPFPRFGMPEDRNAPARDERSPEIFARDGQSVSFAPARPTCCRGCWMASRGVLSTGRRGVPVRHRTAPPAGKGRVGLAKGRAGPAVVEGAAQGHAPLLATADPRGTLGSSCARARLPTNRPNWRWIAPRGAISGIGGRVSSPRSGRIPASW